jgi:hypothetical protein
MKRRLHLIGLILMSLAILFAFCALSFFIYSIASIEVKDQVVLINGTHARGKVIGRAVERTAEDTPYYWITYTFMTNTGELVQDANSEPLWSNLKVGNTIEVVYEPNNPQNNKIVGSSFLLWSSIAVSFLAIAGIIFVAFLVLRWFVGKIVRTWKEIRD